MEGRKGKTPKMGPGAAGAMRGQKIERYMGKVDSVL